MKRHRGKRGRRTEAIRTVEIYKLRKPRKGATLQIEIRASTDGRVLKYSLSYINPMISSLDNGRILGYDNAHGYTHRHYMGTVQAVDFASYDDIAERYFKEVYEIWGTENG